MTQPSTIETDSKKEKETQNKQLINVTFYHSIDKQPRRKISNDENNNNNQPTSCQTCAVAGGKVPKKSVHVVLRSSSACFVVFSEEGCGHYDLERLDKKKVVHPSVFLFSVYVGHAFMLPCSTCKKSRTPSSPYVCQILVGHVDFRGNHLQPWSTCEVGRNRRPLGRESEVRSDLVVFVFVVTFYFG